VRLKKPTVVLLNNSRAIGFSVAVEAKVVWEKKQDCDWGWYRRFQMELQSDQVLFQLFGARWPCLCLVKVCQG